MTDLRLNFAHPWLLLLFIPAIALALFYHLRLAKRYRRTRNRIVSLVLYGIVAALCVTVLSGFTISYDKPNSEKELLLVVDLSYGNADRKEDKDAFVEAVLKDVDSAFKTGVVTFGYDQVYAAELSYDSHDVYDKYLAADRPDGSATDIASALSYARSLFSSPETAKIVLVSDGMQTDGSALSVIKSLVADGTKVDTVYFPSGKIGDEVQITGVGLPDFNVAIGDTFTIDITLQSSYAGSGYITVYDSGNTAQDERKAIEFSKGVSTVSLEHVFAVPGMHELSFTLECGSDTEEKNNEYHSFFYVEIHENVLIIQRADSEADILAGILTDDKYKVTVVKSDDTDKMPASLKELREYDQVILLNIANADLPEGFDEILYKYVDEAGGGLFTVGGSRVEDGKNVANAYNKEDMYYYDEQHKQTVATPYQQLLPVQSITYKPPVGVMIIIDRSGSMGMTDGTTGKTLLDLAKEGAMESVKALDERDYFGVMTLSDKYEEAATVNPVPKMHDIITTIDEIEIGGGTVFTGAIQEAGRALLALDKVQKRHIILVTDAMPGDKYEDYSAAIEHNYQSGVTFSAIALNADASYVETLNQAAQLGGGRCYGVDSSNFYKIPDYMKNDLRVPEIQGYTPEEFTPAITGRTAVVSGVTQEEMPALGGYYGTKIKSGAEVSLSGEFAPIYAQWKFGNGTVGSFMCDLSGVWSDKFLASPAGKRILHNIIIGLMPTENIRQRDVEIELTPDNYTTHMSVYTTLSDNESVRAEVVPPGGLSDPQTISAEGDYSRLSFKNTEPGVYTVSVAKQAEDGTITSAETVVYKAFSYSLEYDCFRDAKEGEDLMESLAAIGGGSVVSPADHVKIYSDFVEYLHRVYDPRWTFIIIAIVLFLLDVAVRKFKFKWIHEMIRESKEKKAAKQGGTRS